MGVLALKSRYMCRAATGFSTKVPPSVIAVVCSCDVLLAHLCLRFLGATALDINNLQDADYQIIKRMIEYAKSHG
jgi:hypothetical protein